MPHALLPFATHLSRRDALAALSLSVLPALGGAAAGAAAGMAEVATLIGAGGCAVLLRHAATDPGVGDPPEFKLGVCSTQRNLSAAGQSDARRIGAWFASHKLVPRAVLTSRWCRCQDTAQLAFGQRADWAPLNSTFSDRLAMPDQTRVVRQALAKIPKGRFEVWVTHQVNITALTGEGTVMGEAIIVDRLGAVLARSRFG